MSGDHSDTGPPEPTTSRRRFLGTTTVGAIAGITGITGVTTGIRTASATRHGKQKPVVPDGPAIGLEPVADGFNQPTDFAVPAGGTRKFVLNRTGQVFVLDGNGKPEKPFLDIADRMAEIDGEQGLLGIALHPNFLKNGTFYLRYSEPPTQKTPKPYSHNEVLSEFQTAKDGSADPNSERKLLAVAEPQSNHNGGAVVFGPDGYLYTSFGDGGGANDMGTGHVSDWYVANDGGNGQDVTENFLGSILRIDVDSRTGEKPYGIPTDNPLVGKTGLDEHFAWGFRNPWRMGFSNGDLYAADVGQEKYEEVDIVRKGGNYGWNVYEGTHCFDPDSEGETSSKSCPDSTPPSVRGGEPLRMPIIEYPHSRDGRPVGKSVIGGYIYEGSIAALDGTYVFGDFVFGESSSGALFAATPAKKGLWSFSKLDIATADDGELPGSLLAIGRDNENELYALTDGETGAVHRLVSRQRARKTTTDETTVETDATTGTTTTDTEETTSSDGPGFGVLAALAGLVGVGARVLGDRE